MLHFYRFVHIFIFGNIPSNFSSKEDGLFHLLIVQSDPGGFGSEIWGKLRQSHRRHVIMDSDSELILEFILFQHVTIFGKC